MRRWLPLLLLLPAALYLLRVRDEFPLGWDHNLYAALAGNLATGAGYTYQGVPHIKYPPGYPLLLAPVVAAFGLDYRVLAWCACAGTVAAVYAAYGFVARRHGTVAGVCVAGWFACHSLTVLQSAQVLSDLPFTAALFLALDQLDRWLEGRARPWPAAAWLLGALLLRLAGLALLPAALLAWLFRRAPRPRPLVLAAVLAAGALPAAAWFTRAALVRATTVGSEENLSYEQELLVGSPRTRLQDPAATGALTRAGERIAKNAPALVRATGALLSGRIPGVDADWRQALGWLLGALLAAALVVALRSGAVSGMFLLAYGAMLLLWPWPELMDRFLLPTLPLLALSLWQLCGHAGPRQAPRLRTVLFAGLLLLQVEPTLARLRFLAGSTAANPVVHTLQQAADWIAQQAPPEARVVAENAPWLHLKTGRTCVFPPVVAADALLAWLRRGDLVVVQSIDSGRVNAALAQARDRFQQRFATRGSDGTVCLVLEVLR